MRDFDEHNITTAVLERFANTPDPRLKQIMSSLVTHLHDFVRDVELSFDEWSFAIDFLTRTGHMCDDKRQEFILLSDTLGVSMLVDAINHRMPAGATETTVLGPFYVQNPPEFANGADLAEGETGEKLLVEGTVSSAAGQPLVNAIVDVWHSDQEGFYDVQDPSLTESSLRGRLRTDGQGRFHFWTAMPRWYPIPADGPVGQMLNATKRHPNRPAHVHFMIQAPGHEMLVTHVFSDDSPYLDSDAVFGVKNSLIRPFTHGPAGEEAHGRYMNEAWRRLSYDFGLKPAA
ncbi:MAG TPA: intradiol ring-cleavage dioxygenase [Stellaceae bacterium]|nr:intradiol ring-cleavage dioxygenase [Stellaceae bacterium]